MDSHSKWVSTVFDETASRYKSCSFFDYFGKGLIDYSHVKPNSTVLDIATGRGAVLFTLSQVIGPKGSAVGIDISANMVEKTQLELETQGAHWTCVKQMDAQHLDFPDDSFDYVSCGFALSFFPSLPRSLQEIRRVLKPKGHFATSIWNRPPPLQGWTMKEAEKLGANKKMGISRLKGKNALREVLQDAGFCNISFKEDSLLLEYPSVEVWWDDLWHHGTRACLGQLSEKGIDFLKRQVLEKVGAKSLSSEKLTEEYSAIYGLCENPH